jgi:hypothetical protein
MENNDCCPGEEWDGKISIRIIYEQADPEKKCDVVSVKAFLTQNVIDYKVSAYLSGYERFKTKSIANGEIETKANVGRQIASSIASALIPGDISPVRSPIRSAFWRAVTPGGGGRGGSRPGENRGYRCPEGYQYGGRFTDSRLSTCGQKLFDIPSILRSLLEAPRGTRVRGGEVDPGSPVTPGEYPDDMIQRRKPQIPKVSAGNPRKANIIIKDTSSQISDYGAPAQRMVRRDGFVLEPVVPPSVLRAIPDNRDMEGATYILSAFKSSDIGKDELGLLSNTGVQRVIYVLPGGSTVSIEKARKLSVGERRKLGRTVNTAIESQVGKNPISRLDFVASEMGDGISVRQNLVGVKNISEALSRKPKPQIPQTAESESKESLSKGKITSIRGAIQHILSGGSMSKIAPEIMPQVLSNSNEINAQRLARGQQLINAGDRGFFLYTKPEKYQHIGEMFASDLQRYMGLLAPEVSFAGRPNEARPYIREDVETAGGGPLNTDAKLEDLDPRDVAAMMLSDYLTDQRERPNSSIYPIDSNSGTRLVLAQNVTSGLVALDEVSVTERSKMKIDEFNGSGAVPNYSEYYGELKEKQQALFRKHIQQLIEKARRFRFADLKKRMAQNGLSDGERTHIKIVETLFNNRLESLSDSKDKISEIFESPEGGLVRTKMDSSGVSVKREAEGSDPKAEAMKVAAMIGCKGVHQDKNGKWLPCSDGATLNRISNAAESDDFLKRTEKAAKKENKRKVRKVLTSKPKAKKRFSYPDMGFSKPGEVGVYSAPGVISAGIVSAKSLDKKSSRFGPEYVRDNDPDVFTDPESARFRARQLGCIGVSRRTSKTGKTVWMPCTNMSDYSRVAGTTDLGRRSRRSAERSNIRRVVMEELDKSRRKNK